MKNIIWAAVAACVSVSSAVAAELKSRPLWDLARDAGTRSEQLAKDGFLPLNAAHAFELPHTAVKDSQAFTVEMKIRCEDVTEKRTVSLLSQKTPTTGWGLSLTLWRGIGSPIMLAANDAMLGCGWFRTKPGEDHTFIVTARKGMVVVYWNGRVLKRFFQTIVPNLEPVQVGDTKVKANSAVTEMQGVKLLSLKFWGPEEEYYAPGESKDFAEGFRGGPGWLMSCPTEDPAKKLPRILCYGDSILNGYGPRLRKRLEGKAYVYTWSKFEGGAVGERLWSAPYAAACKVQPFDCIVFNNGLHSLHWTEDKVSDELLKATQRQIYRNFRDNAPQAKIWWLSTTPHTSREKNAEGQVFKTGELDPVVLRINRLTAEVMAEEKVPVLDGYGALSGHLDLACGDSYHWKGAGYDRLVDLIAETVIAPVTSGCATFGGKSHCLGDGAGLKLGGVTVNGEKVCEIERRVEKDGVAMRYRLPRGRRIISGEDTVWTLPTDATCWYQEGPGGYEHLYTKAVVGTIPVGTKANLPITFRLADGTYRLITEANLVDYTDLAVEYVGEGRFRAIYYAEEAGAFEQTGADTTPWRLTIIADDLNALANSDLVRRLCPAPTDARSIALRKPGRCTWQWLPSGDPKYPEQKDWYDRTKALGFEYYLIDDGWKVWRDGEKDQWACLKSAIDYGKSIGVKTAMWVDSKEMPDARSRRAYLEKVVAAGAVGIKIDFIPRCDSKWCKWYEETLRDTAELGLFVDFHGAVKPTGRERTWPHEMAREAIRGHEWHVTRYKRVLPPEHDTILPFCRLVQGHGDYTPVVFEKAQLIHFTWPRQLAQGVVMACPFLCYGDYPKNYQENPMREILAAMPSVYDETIVLPGSEIGECVAMAKRKDGRWFLAVENGAEARKLDIGLGFLGAGRWRLLGFRDDPSGRLDAAVREERTVTSGESVGLDIRPCGGYVAMIVKQGD